MTLTLEPAETIVSRAREVARERGLKPITICVVDAGGVKAKWLEAARL